MVRARVGARVGVRVGIRVRVSFGYVRVRRGEGSLVHGELTVEHPTLGGR